jgi:hypothetical protein
MKNLAQRIDCCAKRDFQSSFEIKYVSHALQICRILIGLHCINNVKVAFEQIVPKTFFWYYNIKNFRITNEGSVAFYNIK